MKKSLSILMSAVMLFAGIGTLSACKGKEQAEEDKLFENCIKYSEFGAKGDGKTDDFEALKSAHAYANEHGVPVKADKGAHYYIACHEATITVKTSTDWGNARFTVDDKSAVEGSQEWWYPLFDVRPDSEGVAVEIPENFSIKAGQSSIGISFEKPALLYIVNDNKKDFIRYGSNQDSGESRQEVVLVDKSGKVDSTTPVMWDYDKVTKLTAYSVEENSILLRGGKFTTIANDDSKVLHYYNRAIDVKRSNTTVKNVQHFVTGEGDTGSPYNGFFRANYANNVTFENCVMTGHKIYTNANGVRQGTYDTRLSCSNDIKYIGCTQSNDPADVSFWGIMCSDYCKNLSMDKCKLSRFDAHKGVWNAAITNCEIGQNISVTGGGTLTVSNVLRKSLSKQSGCNRFVSLRDDYGSFWNGDIIIKDSTLLTVSGINYVISLGWHNHYFGYPCYYTKRVTIDNVKIEYYGEVTDYKHQYIFSHITETEGETQEFAAKSANPPVLPQQVIIKNEQTVFALTANKFGWLKDVPIIHQ